MDRTFSLIKKGKPVKTFKGKAPYALAKKIANSGAKSITLVEPGTTNTYKYRMVNGKLKSTSLPKKQMKVVGSIKKTKSKTTKTKAQKKMKGGGKFDVALAKHRKKPSQKPLQRRESPIRPRSPSSDSSGKFTSRQLQNRIYHCYIVPFTFVNGQLEILIAKKLCFNKEDGWIHNNPGQYVFFGGHCRNTSERDVYESSLKEFEEESGNQLQNKRNTVLKRWDDFSTLFYQVESKDEYRKFSKLRSKSPWKEIDHAKWVGAREAFKIMNPRETRYNNKICYGNVRNFVEEYMKHFKVSKMQLRDHYAVKVKRHIKQKTGRNLSDREFADVIKDIAQKQTRSKYYEPVADFFFMFIRKKIKTDWFHDALVYLDRDILS